MGTYELPRNVKGEGRILFIFTPKSLIWTVASGGVGFLFYFICAMFNMQTVGYIVIAVFALIGFLIGTVKIPEIGKLEFTQKTGGENIDDIIRRAIKFKSKGRKIYIYKEENNND